MHVLAEIGLHITWACLVGDVVISSMASWGLEALAGGSNPDLSLVEPFFFPRVLLGDLLFLERPFHFSAFLEQKLPFFPVSPLQTLSPFQSFSDVCP
jgi:hypothetical protein